MSPKEKLALIESLCRQVDSAQLRLGAEDPEDAYLEIGLGEIARRLQLIVTYLKQVAATKGEGQ